MCDRQLMKPPVHSNSGQLNLKHGTPNRSAIGMRSFFSPGLVMQALCSGLSENALRDV